MVCDACTYAILRSPRMYARSYLRTRSLRTLPLLVAYITRCRRRRRRRRPFRARDRTEIIRPRAIHTHTYTCTYVRTTTAAAAVGSPFVTALSRIASTGRKRGYSYVRYVCAIVRIIICTVGRSLR